MRPSNPDSTPAGPTALSTARLGIVVALPAEARPLLHVYGSGLCGPSGSAGVLLEVTGMGAERAGAGARRLVQRGATALLSWGTAAGLQPGLRPGAVALPQVVIDADERRYAVDAAWHRHMLALLAEVTAPVTAPLAVSAELLQGPGDKQALYRRSGATCADMESGAVAGVAHEAALPFLALRVVVDPATGILPGWLMRAADTQGLISPARLLFHAAAHPGDWAHLVRLGRWFKEARRALTRVARRAEPQRFGVDQR